MQIKVRMFGYIFKGLSFSSLQRVFRKHNWVNTFMNSHVHLYLTISINLYKPFVLILFSDFEKQKHIVTL